MRQKQSEDRTHPGDTTPPAQPSKKRNTRPVPPHQRRTGAGSAVQIVLSLVLVALVGYQGVRLYRSFTPISPGSEDMQLIAGSDMSGADSLSAEESTPTEIIYQSLAVSAQDIHAGDLILVNNDYAYEEQNPAQIVSIYDHKTENYHVSGTEVRLRENAITALNEMLDDFYVATGHQDILILSGYRTTERQQELYDEDLAATGQETSTRVARPGYSEHETGYALDVTLYADGVQYDYDGTGDYDWLNQNCGHYGYILRYAEDKVDVTGYQAEPWHYRYVGQPHATYMYENNLCLEEYLALLKDYIIDAPLSITNWDGQVYAVYYTPADTAAETTYVMVPSDRDYTISGNNSDGWIVTVDTGQIASYDAPADQDASADSTASETSAESSEAVDNTSDDISAAE